MLVGAAEHRSWRGPPPRLAQGPQRLPVPTSRALQLGHIRGPSVFLPAAVGVCLQSVHFGFGSCIPVFKCSGWFHNASAYLGSRASGMSGDKMRPALRETAIHCRRCLCHQQFHCGVGVLCPQGVLGLGHWFQPRPCREAQLHLWALEEMHCVSK